MLFYNWQPCLGVEPETRARVVNGLLQKLPRRNFLALKYLMNFLHEVSQHSGENKMDNNNLAVVFGPNLIWSTEQVRKNILSENRWSFAASIPGYVWIIELFIRGRP